MAGDGDLTDPTRAKLRLLSVPAYAFIGLILGRNIQQLGIALKRNLLFHLLVAMPFVSVLWSVSPSIT